MPLPLSLREWRAHARFQASQLAHLGPRGFLRWHEGLLDAWLKERGQRHRHVELTEADLRASRRSDTVFVFGSGYSLHDIPPREWARIAEHDTLGFSGFIYAPWVRVDYHLIRGWVENQVGRHGWQAYTKEFVDVLHDNPNFRDTILVLQGEYYAQFCNALVGYSLLRPGTRIARFQASREHGPPSRTLRDGLRHNAGTLSDAVNLAVCLGWKRIVLAGVDLYDNRYFWLKPDETTVMDPATGRLVPAKQTSRGLRYDQQHNTVRNGIVDSMAAWREDLLRDGVELMVYNPRSLLASALPVFRFPAEPPRASPSTP